MEKGLIFRLILGGMFLVVIVTRKYFEQRAVKTAHEGLDQDKDSRNLIALQSLLLTVSNLGMIAYLINPNWMAWSTLSIPEWLLWLGVVIGASGTALLVWTHIILGKNFFGGMKTRQGHQLVVAGPYRWVRHPMYTAFLAIGLAWFLLSGNWMVAGFWLVPTILVIVTRLTEEERMMLKQFGDKYSLYQQRTGRFLPRLNSSASSRNSSA